MASGRVKSGRSSWNLFVPWVHDQFMQVFSGKNTNCISQSFWYTLEFGYKLVHCLKFSTRQGFKGAEFLKSPKNLIFRQIYLQDNPRCGNLSEASECFVWWFLKKRFSPRGDLNLLMCLQQLLGTPMPWAWCHLRSCQSSVNWDEGLSLDSWIAWVWATWWRLGHLVTFHSTTLRGFPPAHWRAESSLWN